MVEPPGIQILLSYLCPKKTIKSPTALAKYKLPMLYKNIEKHAQKHLDEDTPKSKVVAHHEPLFAGKYYKFLKNANEVKKGHRVLSVFIALLKNFQLELETHLPEKGISCKYYNYGNFFNQSKRGVGVKLVTNDTGKLLEMINFLLENHP